MKTFMEDIFLKDLGKSIRNLRKQSGMSQEMLGELANICPKHLGEIERGDSNPSVAIICKIANALNRAPSDIMNINSNTLSEKEYYLKKFCALLRDKDVSMLHNVFQAMELLMEERGEKGGESGLSPKFLPAVKTNVKRRK